MLAKKEPIFNIPYSLPSNTHSISIATRRPTARILNRSTKYIPDHADLLEIPGGEFKNNGLTIGFPFLPMPYYVRLVSNLPKISRPPSTVECLAITSHLNSDERALFSTVRAIRSKLYFDYCEQIPCQDDEIIETTYNSTTYTHVPYPYNITGIKYNDSLDDLLFVKFSCGLKLLRLNKSYQLPSSQPTNESRPLFPDQSAIDFIESFPEKRGYTFGDACIGSHNKGLIGLASANNKDLQIRLYDITRNQKKLFNCLQQALCDDSLIDPSIPRRQSLRNYVAAKKSMESVQQLDCDTNHLFNMVLTTSHKVSIIDPRQSTFGVTIFDKTNMINLIPSEMIVKSALSTNCDNQIYCMSNMNLRVLDRRFPSTPISTTAHMLDPTSHEAMQMRVVGLNENNLETICMSSGGRLAIITYDRSRAQNEGDTVVTPRVPHMPVHEPSPVELTRKLSDELIGLCTTTDCIFKGGVMFSAAQLSRQGDVCIRAYMPYRGESYSPKSQAQAIVHQYRSENFRTNDLRQSEELYERNIIDQEPRHRNSQDFIDLDKNDDIEALGQALTSTRAMKKYDNMKRKLRRI